MFRLLILTFFICCFYSLRAQTDPGNSKRIIIDRTNNIIKIDGVFDEADWAKSVPASQFILNEPNPGAPASQATEVRVLYDDKALYIAAMLLDNRPDSIMQQLTERDEIGVADWFGVVIDPYQGGLNGSGFIVTASGVQFDTRYSGGRGGGRITRGDSNWDAVWQSKTRITDNGWAVELKIPFSALRFPKSELQTWNINFARMVRRSRQQSFWNEVKPEVQGLLNQSGQLMGIKDISSPVRLSATPFLAVYAENYHDKNETPVSSWGRSFNGGMDIKYGINDAFTLDMTLIPDFGQTQSDNEILNLSPFEVEFDENRQFFTEGTELFNKGNLFYSRRVGGRPFRYSEIEDNLTENEKIIDNPQISQLINATKVSGRTNNGLGIGVFNATAGRSFATIENTETGERRKTETDPLTNYSVIVFDQNLKNNSFVSLINTNVWRNGSAYEANVTGTQFSLRNKNNSYAINGRGAISQKYWDGVDIENGQDSIGLGHSYRIELEKTSGNFRFGTQYSVDNRHYDINDLGINFRPNQKTIAARANYNIFKPFGAFNRAGIWSWMQYSRLDEQNAFTRFSWNVRSFMVTKGFFAFGAFGSLQPFKNHDYYEPRTGEFNQFYAIPKNGSFGFWGSSDFRKRFAFEFDAELNLFNEEGRRTWEIEFGPRLRVNDKLSFQLDIESEIRKNDIGYVSTDETAQGFADLHESDIVFSRRDQLIFDNVLSGNYIFSNNMSLTLRARHYWTKLEYDRFNTLLSDGNLGPTSYKGVDDSNQSLHNTSFNIFNVDMVYRWRFAPGSDLFFVWKNSIFEDNDNIDQSYLYNLGNLFNAPQRNSFSLKVVYYLDYLDVVPPA